MSTPDALIERLREVSGFRKAILEQTGQPSKVPCLKQQAADEIERLCAEIERLRGIVPEVLERLNDELCAENERLRAEAARLEREVHNLNWALSTPGYEQMATPEDQAEHEAGMARVTAVLDRMAAAKAEHDAMEADAARYQFLRDDFSPMGLNIDGNHAWAYRRNATLKGPNLDSAIDAAMRDATNVGGNRLAPTQE